MGVHNDDEDIRDVLREERGRGRRPVDTEAEKVERELRDGYRRLISAGASEKGFRDGRDSARSATFLNAASRAARSSGLNFASRAAVLDANADAARSMAVVDVG